MRCAKCGYVSFDYLSECKKCQTSMAAAREGFGFLAVKPAVPSLLGSLLNNVEPPAQQKDAVAETETFPSFNFAEDAQAAFREKPEVEPSKTASAMANPDEAEEDFSLLDLSDEELELLIDKETLGSGETAESMQRSVMDQGAGKRPPEPFSAPEPAPPAPEISLPAEDDAPSTAAQASDELVLNFDDYTQGPESEATETAPAIEPITGSIDAPAGLEKDAEVPFELNPEPDQSPLKSDDSTDDFVIDLSENDLDAFLDELSSTPKGAA